MRKNSRIKKDRKKIGFTLIELLAVIVVLLIIALIATPLVLKYINNAKLRSFETSINGVKNAIDYYVMNKELNDEELYNHEVVNVKDLNLKNKDNLSGTVTIYKNGDNYTISYNNITDGTYIAKGDNENNEITDIRTANKPILLATDDKIVIDSYKYYIYGIDNPFKLETLFKVVNGDIGFVKSNPNFYGTGTKIIVKKDGNIVDTYTVVIFGDINGDSAIDAFDASLYNLALSGNHPLSEYQFLAADINRNGKLEQEEYQIFYDLVVGKCEINQQSGKVNC